MKKKEAVVIVGLLVGGGGLVWCVFTRNLRAYKVLLALPEGKAELSEDDLKKTIRSELDRLDSIEAPFSVVERFREQTLSV